MITVLAAYLDLEDYQAALEAGTIPRPESCPFCSHGSVWFNGFYRRYAHTQNGSKILRNKIRVRRCRCSACKKGWSLLPGFCIPHKQFGAETIEWALTESCVAGVGDLEHLRDSTNFGPSPRTVRRWIHWLPALVREQCMDLFRREKLPGSRKTAAASLSLLREWYHSQAYDDPSPLRTCLHGMWESTFRPSSPGFSQYPMLAR